MNLELENLIESDFSNCCRTCLSERTDLENIFQSYGAHFKISDLVSKGNYISDNFHV